MQIFTVMVAQTMQKVNGDPVSSFPYCRRQDEHFAPNPESPIDEPLFHTIIPVGNQPKGWPTWVNGQIVSYKCRSAGPCVSCQMRTTQNTSNIVHPRPRSGILTFMIIHHSSQYRISAFQSVTVACWSVAVHHGTDNRSCFIIKNRGCAF